VVSVADPALSVPVPITVAPSEKVTVPVAVPPLVVTLAVNVTLAPNVLGFTLDTIVVVLVAICTVCSSAADVLPLSFVSPPYTAVSVCAPTASVDVVSVAIPLAFNVPVPSGVVPSIKVAVPVATPPFPVTVAVSVTVMPAIEGVPLDASAVAVVAEVTVSAIGVDALAT